MKNKDNTSRYRDCLLEAANWMLQRLAVVALCAGGAGE